MSYDPNDISDPYDLIDHLPEYLAFRDTEIGIPIIINLRDGKCYTQLRDYACEISKLNVRIALKVLNNRIFSLDEKVIHTVCPVITYQSSSFPRNPVTERLIQLEYAVNTWLLSDNPEVFIKLKIEADKLGGINAYFRKLAKFNTEI